MWGRSQVDAVDYPGVAGRGGTVQVHAENVLLVAAPHPYLVDDPTQSTLSRARDTVRYDRSRSVQLDAETLEDNRLVAFAGDGPEVEHFRLIRTQILQRAGGKGGVTVMVTSALPGEGKTLVAVNLALTFAKEYNQTALLVDCDLRQQAIHKTLGFPGDRGLVDYLVHECPVPDLMVWPGIEKLTVISGGRTLSGSTELLGSPRMRELVVDLKRRYPERYVFFDVPSLLASADPLAFAPLVDYVVVQAGKTAAAEIRKALKMLPREKIVGLVLNRQEVG